ncbi:methyltransferase domain-containing protein [Polaribacter litorisediminis]|uniref:methyltransferase domain-containing protein n=1 Tax=Polaribacter litorisediminis TaxID=1908341 RepID=UPI001CC085FD|nr:methyltransferase domain-containing protein [Polaribacter litorisediminis]UAM98206.1 methyltransferase domain-containing protein [Polaribacter litorisediminis]
MEFNEDFWNNKYANNKIGWDLGEVSPPLKAYFDQLENKDIRILIPGGGNSYEAEYLFNKGFKNVYVVDISEIALQNILDRVPNFPSSQLIHANFFELEETFDLVIEQTFFCAIHPELRTKYGVKMNAILQPQGKLVGLLFDAVLNEDHPPFGGNKNEYLAYFQSYFKIKRMEPCYNSFHNRKGMELFVKLEQK